MSMTLRAARHRLGRLGLVAIAFIACGRTARQSPGQAGEGGGASEAGSPAGGSLQVDATCTLPEPKSGFVECNEGWHHRPFAERCEIRGDAGASTGGAGGDVDQRDLPRVEGGVPCYQDPGICAQFQWGHCQSDEGASCVSGCEVDADCGPDAICVCSGPSPTGGDCRHALCHTDAECPGSLCASAYGDAGGLACLSARDECLTIADCVDTGCIWDESSSARVCADLP